MTIYKKICVKIKVCDCLHVHIMFFACLIKSKVSLLKVLTNEKRGGLRVISFDRSPFKLISQKFSTESVQAPSSERHKTTQRTLFLLFANNN